MINYKIFKVALLLGLAVAKNPGFDLGKLQSLEFIEKDDGFLQEEVGHPLLE